MRKLIIGLIAALLVSCSKETSIKQQLEEYVAAKDARIGIAVIVNDNDTIEVNGREPFPMLSVYKFPQALAVGDHCRRTGASFTDSIDIESAEIKENTWSPLREKYGVTNLRIPLRELLKLTLQQSDNNACDILFRYIGGTDVADSLITAWGFPEIKTLSTEDEMHQDTGLCYINSSTPLEMARLVNQFNDSIRATAPEYEEIARLMENCETGTDRLAAPFKGKDVIISHKTGTGDLNADGRIIAVNDCGYVVLPDGTRYAIAVFVSDSAYDMTETAKIIAQISELIMTNVTVSY